MRAKFALLGLLGAAALGASAMAAGQSGLAVMAEDQDVAGGAVTTAKVMADANGWLVVHRTDSAMKPGSVIGYAPLKKGVNADVAALLTEPAKPGDMLMLMLHGEAGGRRAGVFEYTLGAKEDGPVRVDGRLVMTVVHAR